MAILNDESMWLKDKRVEYQKYSINNIVTYYWNKYNATSTNSYSIHYSYTSGKYYGKVRYSVQSSTIKQSNGRFQNLSSATFEGINVGHWFMASATGPAYYCSQEFDYTLGDDFLGYSRIATIVNTPVYSQGSTSYGEVSSISSSAYPSRGRHTDGYWYVKSTKTTSTQEKGSLIETFKAKDGEYPDNGVKDGYWYVKIS